MKFITLLLLIYAAADDYKRSEFMPASSAQKKWGNSEFAAELFKTADVDKRASMAASAVLKKSFKGQPMNSVRDKLGKPDGFFFSDRILAYQIQFYGPHTKQSWQLVFIPDESGEKVNEIKIHKKCCYPEGK